jgi:DNA-binding CsgD family transcriptional regulator
MPHLDEGLGAFGYHFDMRRPAGRWLDPPVFLGRSAALAQTGLALLSAGHDMLSDEQRAQIYVQRTPRVCSSSELLNNGQSLATYAPTSAVRAELPFQDFFGVRCNEPGGTGCVVGAFLPTVKRTPPTLRRRWTQISAHIEAGLRMRRRLHEQAPVDEAVFTASGRIEHLEPRARLRMSLLAHAVANRAKARGPARRGAAALDLWEALVDGRWSLVDRFESDGRRFTVARVNEPDVADPRALSPRERAVARLLAMGSSNKLIGYELGLREGTIAALVARLRHKLGGSSRTDLAARLAGTRSGSPVKVGDDTLVVMEDAIDHGLWELLTPAERGVRMAK